LNKLNKKEKDILDALKQGNESAVSALFETLYRPLCVYSVQITDSLESTEDIVQDIFLRFWEKKIYLSIQENLRSYLFNAVRNASVDYLRRKRPFAMEDIEEFSYLPMEEDIDEEELLREKEKLHHVLQQLSPQEYSVLMSIVVENKKYKEVAEELQISVNTVKTHLSRALKFLRTQHVLKTFFFTFL
jgi:RNA polymerase sigma-70 factor (ECF subfamily)